MGQNRLNAAIISDILADNKNVSKQKLRSYFGNREYLNPCDFGAKGNGVYDDTEAFEKAIQEAGDSSAIIIPQGYFVISRPLTISKNAVSVSGAGEYATIINYIGEGALFIAEAPSDDLYLNTGSFEGFTIIGNNTNNGIKLGNTSTYRIENIAIQDCKIGIHLCGRELTSISNVRINADNPIVIDKNSSKDPKFLGIDCDHLRISNLLLICTSATSPCIQVMDEVYLSNVTFDGYQSWNLGAYGFYFQNLKGSTASHNVRFDNVRWEQGQSNGYQFFINSSQAQMQRFLFVNCATSMSSFYLRKLQNVTIIGHSHTGATGTIAINADNSVSELLLQNCFWQKNSTAIITGLNTRWADLYADTSIPLPVNAAYTNSFIR